jgi:16S rRNA G966 N2-methylase RsmD
LNESILNTSIQEFINNNLNSDITSLILKGTQFNSVETLEIIEQIESKKKCETKLPTWYATERIYYPNKLNIEQTSSEITAKHKSSLISGSSIIDLTGGFGVDCYYFSKQFKNVTHCEINDELHQIVKHNYNQLKSTNINTILTDGIEYLKNCNTKYDWIYVDPSRRHDSKGKVFMLSDCLPNIPEHIDLLFKHSKNVMIKTSPLLDISIGINELKHVKTIHIVAINNEVKELLWVLEENYNSKIELQTTNLKNEFTESFNFYLEDESNIVSNCNLPLTYLYEPNSAILKAGAFNSISKQLQVLKLHKHSHLYTNDEVIEFPGRCFKIESVIAYNKKQLKDLSITKANITTRNFPETVEQIRKKTRIKDGGNKFLFFTTNLNEEKIVLVCSKIS